jgi:hypothetical protein
MYVFFANKITCVQLDFNTEPLNQNANEKQIKNRINTCFPHTSSLANAAKITQLKH